MSGAPVPVTEGGSVRPLPYSDVIRERWRRPRFRGPLEDAAADVLAEMLPGRRRDEALAVSVQDVLETLAADIRPTRLRCVTLPLTVLAQALGGRHETG
jgi:hypothetical protein